MAEPPEPARLVVSGGRPEPAPARGLPLLATVAVLLAVAAYLGRSVLADLNVDLAPLATTANAYLERGLRLLEGSPPPSEEPTVAAPAVVTPSPAVAAPAAVLGKPIGAAEAAAVVEQFRGAFEARDVDGLVRLFAPDAVENGRRGVQAISAGYRASLPALAEVHYELTRFVVEPQGSRTEVRGPFVISYLRANNDRGELRGEAVFELERRDGLPRITRLDYRADAAQASAPRTPPR